MPINKLFGYNFRRIREGKEWSVEDTAEKGSVSSDYIYGVEGGSKHFGERAQRKWAAIFGVDYREFHKPIQGTEPGIPVVAEVSAGGGIVSLAADEYPVGNGFEFIDLPPGYTQEQATNDNIYAVKIVGDSMYPALKNGWYLYIRPESMKHLKADDLVIFKDDAGSAWVKEIEKITPLEIVFRSIGKGPTIIKAIMNIAVIEKVFLIKP